MKIINIEMEGEIVKCPSCNSENLNENGIKDICKHLIFIGTSHSDDPEIDIEDLNSKYDPDKYEIITNFFKAELDDTYSLFIDSSTRQIDAYLLYRNI
jgi:hypothetical protein|tara:strand:- start:1035 stop:1328 length:294 start_codon:yes stop_codon:yes gene_type:complete